MARGNRGRGLSLFPGPCSFLEKRGQGNVRAETSALEHERLFRVLTGREQQCHWGCGLPDTTSSKAEHQGSPSSMQTLEATAIR